MIVLVFAIVQGERLEHYGLLAQIELVKELPCWPLVIKQLIIIHITYILHRCVVFKVDALEDQGAIQAAFMMVTKGASCMREAL